MTGWNIDPGGDTVVHCIDEGAEEEAEVGFEVLAIALALQVAVKVPLLAPGATVLLPLIDSGSKSSPKLSIAAWRVDSDSHFDCCSCRPWLPVVPVPVSIVPVPVPVPVVPIPVDVARD